MNILLTGATGYLGSHLLIELLAHEYNVIITKRSNSNVSKISSILNQIKFYDIDLLSFEKIFQEQKIDLIIHTSTQYDRNSQINNYTEIIEANIVQPIKLLELSVSFQVKTFINTDTFLDKRINRYSLSKSHFIECAKSFSDKLQIINLRLDHFYGIKGGGHFTSWISKQLLDDVASIDLTSGHQLRDFLYITDVVSAYLIVIKNINNLKSYENFDIGSGNLIRLRDFVEKVAEISQSYKKVSTKLNFGAKKFRKHDGIITKQDLKPIRNLGWSPQININDGLHKIIKDLINEKRKRTKTGYFTENKRIL
jgi:CDP-paratose synthetase